MLFNRELFDISEMIIMILWMAYTMNEKYFLQAEASGIFGWFYK